jgi:hypothetical protein
MAAPPTARMRELETLVPRTAAACEDARMPLHAIKRLALASLMIMVALRGTALADVTNGIRYSVPTGWSAADQKGVRMLAPSDLKAGELMLAIMLGVQAPAGRPEDQIAQMAATINADAKVTSSSSVQITDRGGAGKLYIKNFDVVSSDMGAHGRMIAVLVRGDQRAAILFLITNTKVLQRYGAGVQELLKSLEIDPQAVAPAPARPATPPATPATSPTTPATPAPGHLPTGETPDLYPGAPGWLPSGRGVAIPAARVVRGSPEGMWWSFQTRGARTSAIATIFLADGTRASNPRPGGGTLFDVEGQRKGRGTTGVGTFSVKDGKITQTYDGFTHTDAFKSGGGPDGEWIEIGASRHYPLAPVTTRDLAGTWKAAGQTFSFGADGSLPGGGTWQLDGYLLAIRNRGAAAYITTVGRTGKLLIIGASSFTRE